MADILHEFPINASGEAVFAALTTTEGLDAWWTKSSSAEPWVGGIYGLYFGGGHDWRGEVVRFEPGRAFELKMFHCDQDWNGTAVCFELEPGDRTIVRFQHLGWADANQHFRISSFCWALYLRLLAKYVETGAIVPYEERQSA